MQISACWIQKKYFVLSSSKFQMFFAIVIALSNPILFIKRDVSQALAPQCARLLCALVPSRLRASDWACALCCRGLNGAGRGTSSCASVCEAVVRIGPVKIVLSTC